MDKIILERLKQEFAFVGIEKISGHTAIKIIEEIVEKFTPPTEHINSIEQEKKLCDCTDGEQCNGDCYPGAAYQRLFNAIQDTKGISTQGEMDEIISIVHADFPMNYKMQQIIDIANKENSNSIEEEAEEVYPTGYTTSGNTFRKEGFIAGATSPAAGEYWRDRIKLKSFCDYCEVELTKETEVFICKDCREGMH